MKGFDNMKTIKVWCFAITLASGQNYYLEEYIPTDTLLRDIYKQKHSIYPNMIECFMEDSNRVIRARRKYNLPDFKIIRKIGIDLMPFAEN